VLASKLSTSAAANSATAGPALLGPSCAPDCGTPPPHSRPRARFAVLRSGVPDTPYARDGVRKPCFAYDSRPEDATKPPVGRLLSSRT
jgi:hypothetical protein